MKSSATLTCVHVHPFHRKETILCFHLMTQNRDLQIFVSKYQTLVWVLLAIGPSLQRSTLVAEGQSWDKGQSQCRSQFFITVTKYDHNLESDVWLWLIVSEGSVYGWWVPRTKVMAESSYREKLHNTCRVARKRREEEEPGRKRNPPEAHPQGSTPPTEPHTLIAHSTMSSAKD